MFRIHYTDRSHDISNVLLLKTTNDSDGNPRQLVVALNSKGNVLACIRVQHTWDCIDTANAEFGHYVRTCSVLINVPPAEFRRWNKLKPGEWIWIETL